MRPTSSGPGMADLPVTAVWPISLAYSGSMSWAAPPPIVPSCQATRKAASSATDRIAARRRNDSCILLPRSDALDLEGADVFLRLHRIEGLAHHLHRRVCGGRRGQADLLHQLRGVGGEENLLGHLPVVDVALELAPALHLGQDPHG